MDCNAKQKANARLHVRAMLQEFRGRVYSQVDELYLARSARCCLSQDFSINLAAVLG